MHAETHSRPSPQRRQAILWLLVATACWGVSFPAAKAVAAIQSNLLPGGGGPWFVVAMSLAPRFVIAALLLGAVLWRRLGGMTRLEWRQGLVLGLFTAGGMLIQNDGLQHTDASVSAFLTQFYAIMIPLWLAFRRRRNPGSVVWVCCALVLAGCGILGHFDWRSLTLGRGEIETLIASCFFMGQILTLDDARYAANRLPLVSFLMLAVQGVIFTLLAVWVAPSAEAPLVLAGSSSWLWLTLLLALPGTLASFYLTTVWQSRITATEAGLIYCCEPIFSALFALFLPALFSVWAGISYANETATWSLLVGGGLITLANIALQVFPQRRP